MSRTIASLHSFLLALAAPCLPAQSPVASPQSTPVTPDAPLNAPRTKPRPHAEGAVAQAILHDGPAGGERVLFDQPGDGRIWACGTSYKAAFGADGFVYVPFFGSDAPRNFPVRFVLRSVRVGGRDVAVDGDARPVRSDARVAFDRGAVREVYDLTPRGVEQTFVVDGAAPGDVDVVMEIDTELAEDAAVDGVQFGNALGSVEYGTAWLVDGAARREIAASFAGRALTLRVPAAQRGTGPVVIDPIVTTRSLTQTLRNSELPDIAYDASTDRYLVVWAHDFSATDIDIVAELRNNAGDPVAGSFTTLDITGTTFTWPRVANLNSVNRFLVAMDRFLPNNPVGQQHTIWGRTIDAAAPFSTGGLFQISAPTTPGDHQAPDVGGDPGTGTAWTVVWTQGVNGGFDIRGRQVDASGVPRQNEIAIESGSTVCVSPQISLSNGNGQAPTPRWCVAYSCKFSDTDWDVFGAVLDVNGTITRGHAPIDDTRGQNDMFPFISSPAFDGIAGAPAFMVSYERQTAGAPEMMVKVVDANLNTVVPPTNLTRNFGFNGIYCRVESDGCRFAAMCQIGSNLVVGTLAVVNGALVLHESPQFLGFGATPFLASKRSGGGGTTDYGIAFQIPGNPGRTAIALYQGRSPTGGFNSRNTGCGVGITSSGRPFLGDQVQFTLSSTGTDIAGLLLGMPATEVVVCSNCRLGIDLSRFLILFASPMTLPLPCDPMLVGVTPAVQGFAFGSGPCAAGLRLSSTIDFTIQ